MSSIQFKKSKAGGKNYYVVLPIGDRRKWIRAGSQTEARRLKTQLDSISQAQRLEKFGLSVKEVRIDDCFEEYAHHVKLRASPSTHKRYIRILNTFLTFLKMFHPQIRHMSQVNPTHIESFQKQRLESIELKIASDGERNGIHKLKRLPLPQTVNFEVKILRTFFIWACDRELISTVPTKKVRWLRSIRKETRKLLSESECALFLETAREMSKKNKRMLVYYRAFVFLLNSGLRSGELCHLTWKDINLETGLIMIRPKPDWTPKTYSREFFLNETCLDVLRLIENSSDFIFVSNTGTPLKTDDLRKMLIRVGKKAGLNDFTRVHDLRHTFSSLMQMHGVDPGTVSAILGHRDIDTTRIYTHQTPEHLKKSVNKLRIG